MKKIELNNTAKSMEETSVTDKVALTFRTMHQNRLTKDHHLKTDVLSLAQFYHKYKGTRKMQ